MPNKTKDMSINKRVPVISTAPPVLPLVEGRQSPHLLDQLVMDGVDLCSESLLALSSVLGVQRKVEAQQVVQGAVVGGRFLCTRYRKTS